MRRLHFERAVLGPEIDRVGDACAASFVDHLGRLGAGNIELEVGILFPVAKQEGEFEEELIVRVAQRREGLRARVAIQATVEGLAGAHQLLPAFKVVRVGFL